MTISFAALTIGFLERNQVLNVARKHYARTMAEEEWLVTRILFLMNEGCSTRGGQTEVALRGLQVWTWAEREYPWGHIRCMFSPERSRANNSDFRHPRPGRLLPAVPAVGTNPPKVFFPGKSCLDLQAREDDAKPILLAGLASFDHPNPTIILNTQLPLPKPVHVILARTHSNPLH